MAGGIDVGTLRATITANASGLISGFKDAEKATSGFTAGIAAIGFGALTQKFLEVSDSLAEFRGDIARTFGAGAPQIAAFVKDSVNSFGIAESELSKVAIKFGSVFQSFGFDDSQVAKLTQDFSTIAANISASFADISVEEATSKLQAGLRGSVKALQQFGISVSEETLSQESLRLGLGATVSALTDQQKALVTASAIQRQATKLNGQAADELNTYEGAVGRATATTEQLAAQLGDVLKPAAIAVANAITDLLRAVIALPDEIKILGSITVATTAAFLAANSALGIFGTTVSAIALPVAALAIAFASAYKVGELFFGVFSGNDMSKNVGPLDAIAIAIRDIGSGATSAKDTVENFFGGLTAGVGQLIAAIPGLKQFGENIAIGAESRSSTRAAQAFEANQAAAKSAADEAKRLGDESKRTAEKLQLSKEAAEAMAKASLELATAQRDLRNRFAQARAEVEDGAGAGQIEAAYQRARDAIDDLNKKSKATGKNGISERDKKQVGISLKLELEKILSSNAGAEKFGSLIERANGALGTLTGASVDASKAIAERNSGAGLSDYTDLIPEIAAREKESAEIRARAAAETVRADELAANAALKLQESFEFAANEISQAAVSILGSVSTVVGQIPQKGQKVDLQAGAIGAAAGGAAGAIAGASIGLPPQIGGQVGSALGELAGNAATVSGALDGLASGVKRALGSLLGSLGKIFVSLKPVFNEVGKNVSSLAGAVGGIIGAIAPILGLLAQTLAPFISIMRSAIQPILKALGPVIKSLLSAIAPLLPILIALGLPVIALIGLLEEFGLITTTLNFIGKGLASGLSFLSAAFSFAAFGINKALEFLLRGIGSFVKSLPGLEDVGKSIIKQANNFGKAADDAWKNAMNSVESGAKLAGEAIGISAAESFGGGKDRIKAAQQRARDERKAAAKEAARDAFEEKMNNNLADSGNNAAEALQNLSETIGNATSDFKAEAFRFGAGDALSGAQPSAAARNGSLSTATLSANQQAAIRVDNLNVFANNADELARTLDQRARRGNFVSTGSTKKDAQPYFGRGESR